MPEKPNPLTLKERVDLYAGALLVQAEDIQAQAQQALQCESFDIPVISKMVGFYAAIQYASSYMDQISALDFTDRTLTLSTAFSGMKGPDGPDSLRIGNDPAFFPLIHQLLLARLRDRLGSPREQSNILLFAKGALMACEPPQAPDTAAVIEGINTGIGFIASLSIKDLEAENGLDQAGNEPPPFTPSP